MPVLAHEGLPVSYRDVGEGGAAPALFAHCSLAHSGLWKPILSALADERRALAPDMPAHGGTAPPPEGRSLQLFARDYCIALLEMLDRPAHLVGLSLGGAVLGRVAVARPDLVASLTLIEPVYFHLLRPAGRIREAEEDEALMAEVRERLESGDKVGAIRCFTEVWGAPGSFEKMGDEGHAYMIRCYEALSKDWAMVGGHPPGQIEPADLAALEMPVMLMSGETTPAAAKAILDVVQEAHSSARRRQIAGAGHLAPVSHWQDVLADLREFFADVEARAAA